MAKNSNYKVKVGLFVTISVILFILAIYSIGNRQNLFSNNFHLNVAFKRVNGLQPGNNVRFSGINVGTVEKIEIINDSTILVGLLIKEQVRQFIKKDATASIGSDGLMGNMLVNILPGSNSQKPVDDAYYIQSIEKVQTDDMISTLSNSNENLAVLIEELLEITQGVNKGKGAIGAIMKDSMLANNLKSIIANLNQVSKDATKALKEAQEILVNIKEGEGIVNTLFIDTAHVNSFERIMENLESSSKKILQTTEDLNALAKNTGGTANALHTITNDSTFNANLQETMKEVREGTTKFNENMEALQHNWLFKKYFKKKEKEK